MACHLNAESGSRRLFLQRAGKWFITGALATMASPVLAAARGARRLDLEHLHTGEHLSVVFGVGGRYVQRALERLNHFLRDHYTGEVGSIDPQLFDLLFAVRRELGCQQPFQVISGFRCAATNATLRKTGGGGVAKQSLHMEGRAIDVRLAGAPLADLREAAISLQAGGVGFYPQEEFVHLDTGRVRSW